MILSIFLISIFILGNCAVEAKSKVNDEFFTIKNKYYDEYLFVQSKFADNNRRKAFIGNLTGKPAYFRQHMIWRISKAKKSDNDSVPLYKIKNADKDEFLFMSDFSFDPSRTYVYTWRKFKDPKQKDTFGDNKYWYLEALDDGSYYINNFLGKLNLIGSARVIRNGYKLAVVWQGDPDVWDSDVEDKRRWIIQKVKYPLSEN